MRKLAPSVVRNCEFRNIWEAGNVFVACFPLDGDEAEGREARAHWPMLTGLQARTHTHVIQRITNGVRSQTQTNGIRPWTRASEEKKRRDMRLER